MKFNEIQKPASGLVLMRVFVVYALLPSVDIQFLHPYLNPWMKHQELHGCKMPKLATPLTDTQIKNAKPKDKPYTLVDGGGMSLEMMPIG